MVLLLALSALVFYACRVGMWHDAIHFSKHFLTPTRLEAFISSFGPFAGVVFVAVQALQVVIAPIPGELTGFVGGFLFGRTWGAVLSTLGLVLGSLAAFLIARFFGRPLVEKVVKKEYRDKFHGLVSCKGVYIVIVLFLIPGVPKDSLCYLLGLTPMGYLTFALINLFGRLPGTLMLVCQGAAVHQRHYASFFVLLAGSLLLTIGLYLARDSLTRSCNLLASRLAPKEQKEEG